MVLVDLTSLSPPCVFKGIWPLPTWEEAGICRNWLPASCVEARNTFHLYFLTLWQRRPVCLLLWSFRLPRIRMRLSARLSSQINIYCLPNEFQLLWLVTLVKSSSFLSFKPVWEAVIQTQNYWRPRGCKRLTASDSASPFPLLAHCQRQLYISCSVQTPGC